MVNFKFTLMIRITMVTIHIAGNVNHGITNLQYI